jgi:hypothetical protein
MSDFDDMRLREILERYRVDGDDLDIRHGIPALTPAYLAHRFGPRTLSPREAALSEAKTLGDAIRATELSNDPEPAVGPPDTIVSLGNHRYRIGSTEIHVSFIRDTVLQTFLRAKGGVLMEPDLIAVSGVKTAGKVLRALVKKFPALAAAIELSNRGKRGHRVRIVKVADRP